MRKVMLENLPRRGVYINWSESVGEKIEFTYGDIKGYFIIDEYVKDKSKVKLRYMDNVHSIATNQLKRGAIGTIIGAISKSHRYKEGDVINTRTGKILIKKETIHRNGYRAYDYVCLKCGIPNTVMEANLKKGVGCSVCVNQMIIKGVNDLWTTKPEVAKLLVNKEEGYKYSAGSNKLLNWRCPKCRKIIKNKPISKISDRGLTCKECGDGMSYPEKYLYFLLREIKEDFYHEKSFDWSKNKRFDFYIENKKLIIEVHGEQHYIQGFNGIGDSLEKVIRNDNKKKLMAEQNGIKHYITIDARISQSDYIKKSILDSELAQIYDLTKVNWVNVQSLSYSTFVKSTCDLWNSGIHSARKIGNILGFSKGTILRYLKQGNELGLCEYSIKQALEYRTKTSKSINKKVVKLRLDGALIEEYESITRAGILNGITQSQISRVCRGDRDKAHGFKWMYKEDYIKYIAKKNEKIII